MDYIRLYRRFVYSHYFSEGLRITMGVLLPALLCGYYGYLQKGIFISLGALCASLVDNPGPIHHRRNGMFACCGIIAFVAAITGFSLQLPWLFLIVLPVCCFLFSMIGVYGARVTSIGIAALLVLVMLTHQALKPSEVWLFTLLIFSGGIWYTLLSLLLNRLRPYKLIQQVLGEYVMAAGDYLRTRALFYDRELVEETAYRNLMYSQVQVQQKQDMVAELLFKTRGFVKESNNTSRLLMMAYLDITDLLERTMTAHFDYKKLHEYFGETEILNDYQQLISSLADEMEKVGIALISGQHSEFNLDLEKRLLEEREQLKELRSQQLKPDNLDGFISLRHILDSIDDIAARIHVLHRYTHYDKELAGRKVADLTGLQLVINQDYRVQLFFDNLSWNSNIFRHSIRVTVAAMAAYMGGILWSLGHSYWILLTVIIILKPGFGLTRTRNIERIVGTLIGSAIAGTLLYFIKNEYAILVLLTFFMVIGYSFMRWKYLLSVLFITMYLMLMFHLLDPLSFKSVLEDRVIDTLIGSAIAFIASTIIPAVWERVQMAALLKHTIKEAKGYYSSTAMGFTGQPFEKIVNTKQRKTTWVALANLTDSFNRMLSEPKSKQKQLPEWHRAVVASHMLISHTATLNSYVEKISPEFMSKDYEPLIRNSLQVLDEALQILNHETGVIETELAAQNAEEISGRLQELIKLRQEELRQGKLETSNKSHLSTFKTITDQFYFIQNAANEIRKLCLQLVWRQVKGQKSIVKSESSEG